jgi:hypothetical protein
MGEKSGRLRLTHYNFGDYRSIPDTIYRKKHNAHIFTIAKMQIICNGTDQVHVKVFSGRKKELFFKIPYLERMEQKNTNFISL